MDKPLTENQARGRYSVSNILSSFFVSILLSGISLSLIGTFFLTEWEVETNMWLIVLAYGGFALIVGMMALFYRRLQLLSYIIMVYWVLGTILVIIIAFGPSDENADSPVQTIEEDISTKCTRTEPYPMAEEFKRALSLRNQRFVESGHFYHPTEVEKLISNCYNIQYGDLRLIGGADGLFAFDENSTVNDLRITIDNTFRFNDDALLAVLLHHEITHVIRYYGVKNGVAEPLSCIDDETKAFWEQYNFIKLLNAGEKDAIFSRANNYLHGKSGNQYSDSIFSTIATIFKKEKVYQSYINTTCNKLQTKEEQEDCIVKHQEAVIKQILKDNNYCSGRE